LKARALQGVLVILVIREMLGILEQAGAVVMDYLQLSLYLEGEELMRDFVEIFHPLEEIMILIHNLE
jgi:hypothetical protein